MDCPYFVEPGVAGSCMPTRKDLDRWAELGIRHVVTLAEEWELKEYGGWDPDVYRAELEARGIKWLHWPTPDGYPRAAWDRWQAHRRVGQEGGVLVHCVGGIGRTPTALAAYLIAKGVDAYEALRRVSEVAPSISISESQYYALLELEAEFKHKN
ncbi:MAG: protein-tyrosine phosphatase family protein [Thermoproteus sp. AZ2]|uniref:Protein-tyrosine phosphatase family protein n=1 Tax=Thermoproteus sp. AZ2 TaxID=1609232 RepID=A0ACC6UYQ5_9CREN